MKKDGSTWSGRLAAKAAQLAREAKDEARFGYGDPGRTARTATMFRAAADELDEAAGR